MALCSGSALANAICPQEMISWCNSLGLCQVLLNLPPRISSHWQSFNYPETLFRFVTKVASSVMMACLLSSGFMISSRGVIAVVLLRLVSACKIIGSTRLDRGESGKEKPIKSFSCHRCSFAKDRQLIASLILPVCDFASSDSGDYMLVSYFPIGLVSLYYALNDLMSLCP